MIARHGDDERLLEDDPVIQLGHLRLGTHKGQVELPPHQTLRKLGGILAGDRDLDMGQFVPKDAHDRRKPIDLLSRQESEGKGRFGGVSGPPRRLDGRLDLQQRRPRMIEKGSAGGGQFDAARAAGKQLHADLMFEIPDLTAKRGLGRMQPPFGRHREAAFLGDRDEIAKMPQLHAAPMPTRYDAQPTKSFSAPQ